MPAAATATNTVSEHPALKGLEPASVWYFFEQLSQIPRPSKSEEKVLEWLKAFADQRHLAWQQDEAGNVVIRRPGTSGGEAAPTVVIQGHVDMVAEKSSDSNHDFSKDPIKLIRDGDWVTADGTTLGADNGMGCAAALALLNEPPTCTLPPLECLFTVDEEMGLTGATALDSSMVQGRILLNLDTEEWPDIFVGCAGGGDSYLRLPADLEPSPAPGSHVLTKVLVSGLMGGHSGINIHEGRGNALLMVASASERVLEALPGAKLVDVAGGDKSNALTREASALLLVPSGQQAAVDATLAHLMTQELMPQYGLIEKGLAIEAVPMGRAASPANGNSSGVDSAGYPELCLTDESAQRLLSLLLLLPHGVSKMSHAVEGLVETSNNVASCHVQQPVSTAGGATSRDFLIVCSSRSSIGPALESLRSRVERLARLTGASCTKEPSFPGWNPDPGSKIVQITKDVFREILGGKQPGVMAVHAGLECGIISERLPGLDCVSYGPTITGAHSPDERVQVTTVEPFYQATRLILKKVAEGGY